MQLEHLRYLIAVVEQKSMNKAAARLYCTQPAISNAIKSIESELGFPVIERTAKGVTPTELGKRVVEDAHLMLEQYEAWKQLALLSSNNQPIKIVLTGTAPAFNIISAVAKTQSKNKDLKIDLLFKHSPDAALSHVGERIGIQYKTPEHVRDALAFAKKHRLRLALLQRDEFKLFLNANSPLLLQDEIKLADLIDQKVFLYQDPWRFPYIDRLEESGVELATQMFQENNLMVAVSLMKDAVTIRPSKTAEHNPFIELGTVKIASISDCPMPVNLYVSYPDEKRIYKSEIDFIETLAEFFPDFKQVE